MAGVRGVITDRDFSNVSDVQRYGRDRRLRRGM